MFWLYLAGAVINILLLPNMADIWWLPAGACGLCLIGAYKHAELKEQNDAKKR